MDCQFYEFTPNDTLFFKGAEPMAMGENHTASILFPPLPQTIVGAMRTAILRQHEIEISEYYRPGFSNDQILRQIGRCTEAAPFSLIGPLFRIEKRLLVPAPFNWFCNSEEDAVNITLSKSLKSIFTEGNPLKIASSSGDLNRIEWADTQGKDLLNVCGGNWITIETISGANHSVHRVEKLAEVVDHVNYVFNLAQLFCGEMRSGIQLEPDMRRAKEHHLYSFQHIRLNRGVKIVFGIRGNVRPADSGTLFLGGEQRFGHYEKIDITLPTGDGRQFMSLSPVKATEDLSEHLVATGKPIYAGGWDMHKGFHKPLTAYYPAGTVFSKKIDNNCIAIN